MAQPRAEPTCTNCPATLLELLQPLYYLVCPWTLSWVSPLPYPSPPSHPPSPVIVCLDLYDIIPRPWFPRPSLFFWRSRICVTFARMTWATSTSHFIVILRVFYQTKTPEKQSWRRVFFYWILRDDRAISSAMWIFRMRRRGVAGRTWTFFFFLFFEVWMTREMCEDERIVFLCAMFLDCEI